MNNLFSLKKAMPAVALNKILIHGCCWFFFIIYELSMLYYSAGQLDEPYIYLAYYTLNIFLFYAHYKLLISVNGRFKNYFNYLVILLIELFVYLLIKSVLDYLLWDPSNHITSNFFFHFLPGNLFRGIYFCMLATFYWAAGQIGRYRQVAAIAQIHELMAINERTVLEHSFAKAQNAYLRQQVNPHLLFNTLNFIYQSVNKYSEKAADCVLLLADVLRFSLDEKTESDKVSLEDELAQIQNLIKINQYRFDDRLNFKTNIQPPNKLFYIIPLVLITLTENIFKHGDLSNIEFCGILKIHVDEEGNLVYFSYNKKRSGNNSQHKEIGLKNLRLRLNFAYPEAHLLSIDDTEHFFKLTLHLKL